MLVQHAYPWGHDKTPHCFFRQSQSNRRRQSWLCRVVIEDLRSFRTRADQVLWFKLVIRLRMYREDDNSRLKHV